MIHYSFEEIGPTTPNLGNHIVHVWRLNLPMPKNVMMKLKSTLSADEIGRANRFHFDTHREQFIVSRGGLRNILSRYLKIPSRDIRFLYTNFGKPYLDNIDLTFNISHSGNYIVCAITKKACIGIDIEQIQLDMDFQSIARTIFGEEEYIAFSKLSDQEKPFAFYRYWTRKEAYLKAIGTGLYHPLNQVKVNFSNLEKPKLLNIEAQPLELGLWQLEEIISDQIYIAAIATRQKFREIYLWDWCL